LSGGFSIPMERKTGLWKISQSAQNVLCSNIWLAHSYALRRLVYSLAACIWSHEWCIQNHKAVPKRDINIQVRKASKCTACVTSSTHGYTCFYSVFDYTQSCMLESVIASICIAQNTIQHVLEWIHDKSSTVNTMVFPYKVGCIFVEKRILFWHYAYRERNQILSILSWKQSLSILKI